MQGANGVQDALNRIIQDKWSNLYTGVQDVVNSVHVVHASAFALYQSLYEERTITEEEWRREQSDLRQQIRTANQQPTEAAQLQALPTSSAPVTPKIGLKRLKRLKSLIS